MTSLAELNALEVSDAVELMRQCCGSTQWATQMTAARPYTSENAVLERAEEIWWGLRRDDWLEAFRAHPRLGDTPEDAETRTAMWSRGEQAGVVKDGESRSELLRLNREYEARFGFIFIMCATDRSASDVLDALRDRMTNEPTPELRVAAEEQSKITRLRLKKLLTPQSAPVTEASR